MTDTDRNLLFAHPPVLGAARVKIEESIARAGRGVRFAVAIHLQTKETKAHAESNAAVKTGAIRREDDGFGDTCGVGARDVIIVDGDGFRVGRVLSINAGHRDGMWLAGLNLEVENVVSLRQAEGELVRRQSAGQIKPTDAHGAVE